MKELIFKKHLRERELNAASDEIEFLKTKQGDEYFQEKQKTNDYMIHLEHKLKQVEKQNIDLEIGKPEDMHYLVGIHY